MPRRKTKEPAAATAKHATAARPAPSREGPWFEPDDPTGRAAMRFWSGGPRSEDGAHAVDSHGGSEALRGLAGGRHPETPTGPLAAGERHDGREKDPTD